MVEEIFVQIDRLHNEVVRTVARCGGLQGFSFLEFTRCEVRGDLNSTAVPIRVAHSVLQLHIRVVIVLGGGRHMDDVV